jgi:hypothetical protein
MANTYTLISSVTVGSGGAASISFTSIPSTYTDLCLKISSRASVTDIYGDYSDFLILSLNSNSSAIYSTRSLRAGTSVNSYANTNDTTGQAGLGNGPLTTASSFGNTELYFPNYAGSNNKSISIDGVSESNDNPSSLFRILQAGLFASSTAISTIALTSFGGGNFVQYSTAYLYGISNA